MSIASTTDAILHRALELIEQKRQAGHTVTVRDLLEPLGSRSHALGCIVLAIPFVQPFSLGPLTTAVSMIIMIFGWALLRQREETPIPDKWLGAPIPAKVQGLLHRSTGIMLRWKNRIARPRRIGIFGQNSARGCGFLVLTGALLLAVPIPFLPLSNAFPAIGIICSALGWTEDDDVLKLLAVAFYILSTILFAALGIAVYMLGREAVAGYLPW